MPGQSGLQPHLRPDESPASSLRALPLMVGRVTGTHPESNAVDVALMSGGLLSFVPLLSSRPLSRFAGYVEMPRYQEGIKTRPDTRPGLECFCVVDFLGGNFNQPVVIGFLSPEVNPILGMPTRFFRKEANDDHVIGESMIDPTLDSAHREQGVNIEHFWSDGSFFRIAELDQKDHFSLVHTDPLTGEDGLGKDYDQLYFQAKDESRPRGFFLRQSLRKNEVNLYTDGTLEVKDANLPTAPAATHAAFLDLIYGDNVNPGGLYAQATITRDGWVILGTKMDGVVRLYNGNTGIDIFGSNVSIFTAAGVNVHIDGTSVAITGGTFSVAGDVTITGNLSVSGSVDGGDMTEGGAQLAKLSDIPSSTGSSAGPGDHTHSI